MRISAIFYFTLIVIFWGCHADQQVMQSNSKSPVDYVDPNIGGVGHLLQPTRPTVQVPNQMIRMYPVRKDYLDDHLQFFPLTLISHRQGELFGIFPITGIVDEDSWSKTSIYDHDQETTTPFYYQVLLEDFDINVEFAPGTKTGIYRFTFPKEGQKEVLLALRHGGKLQVSDGLWQGYESFNDMKAWVYGEFSTAGEGRTLQDNTLSDQTAVDGKNSKGWVSFPENAPKTIEFRYGISFISQEQAKANFNEEIKGQSLESMKSKAREAWENQLSKIRVKGGTEDQKRTFYTALYRCFERMINITEDGQYYSSYDHQVHKADRDFYVDDWIWDTHLALHPLQIILNPKAEADKIQSYVRMYEQGGWMPSFPVLWGDFAAMNSNHAAAMVADAWFKGIRDFDIDKAYEGIRKNSTQATFLPWRNGPMCSLDTFYLEHGYYPALHPGEKETVSQVHPFEKRQAVAVTLGFSFDDWNIARLAKDLGKNDDYEYFLGRAGNYRNVYNSEKGFMWPKDAQGNWIEGIDPAFSGGPGGRDYYDECNAYTYNWLVQQDIDGLIGLMGGKEAFTTKLDELFTTGLGMSKYAFWAKFPDATGLVGQYVMGNEPDFHIPYLYNYAGIPWETQKRIRMLLKTWFPDNIFGIPGDEDGGGMSAFVVFSMMGFYPVTPGLPVYTIGSPVFEEISIQLDNGKTFTVKADQCSEKNKYIQSATLDGKPLNTPWFTHQALMNGGSLELKMGERPNKNWGTDKPWDFSRNTSLGMEK